MARHARATLLRQAMNVPFFATAHPWPHAAPISLVRCADGGGGGRYTAVAQGMPRQLSVGGAGHGGGAVLCTQPGPQENRTAVEGVCAHREKPHNNPLASARPRIAPGRSVAHTGGGPEVAVTVWHQHGRAHDTVGCGVRSSPQMRHAFEEDRSLADKYRPLQFDWCVEMYGYVFAAAELGIRHEIKHRLQVCCLQVYVAAVLLCASCVCARPTAAAAMRRGYGRARARKRPSRAIARSGWDCG